nr:hypothetical protein [Tanacetum cinerariifolium]
MKTIAIAKIAPMSRVPVNHETLVLEISYFSRDSTRSIEATAAMLKATTKSQMDKPKKLRSQMGQTVDAAQDQVGAATTTIAKELAVDDITLAKALEALKTSKPKIKGIVVKDHKEPSESTTIPTSITDRTRPKAKDIVIEKPGDELQQESAKKQKVDDDQEATELKRCLAIVPDDEDDVTIDATPLSSKSPTIRSTKKEEKVISKSSGQMVQPVDNMDCYLLHTLKTMFEYHVEDSVWNNQQGLGDELQQESAKKQKVDDDQEATELKRCLAIVPDDEDDVTIDATPLSSKSPTIRSTKKEEKVISKSSGQMVVLRYWSEDSLEKDM